MFWFYFNMFAAALNASFAVGGSKLSAFCVVVSTLLAVKVLVEARK